MKKLFILFLLLSQLTYAADEEKKEIFELKRQKKIEHRLSHQELIFQKRFEKKQALLDKKYHQRLKRLEKRRAKISSATYEKSLAHLNHWLEREKKQLAYEEKHAHERISLRKEKLKLSP